MGTCHLLCYIIFHTRIDRVCLRRPCSSHEPFGLSAVLRAQAQPGATCPWMSEHLKINMRDSRCCTTNVPHQTGLVSGSPFDTIIHMICIRMSCLYMALSRLVQIGRNTRKNFFSKCRYSSHE